MDRKAALILLGIFSISLLVAGVSALTLDFVDHSYLKKNEFNITDQDGNVISVFTGSGSVTVPQGKSYFIEYKPVGMFSFGDDLPADPFYLGALFGYFSNKDILAGLVALIGLVILAGAWH